MLKHILITLVVTTLIALPTGMYIGHLVDFSPSNRLVSPLVKKVVYNKEKPLQQYAIPDLTLFPLKASNITLDRLLDETADYQQFQFSFAPLEKKMSGSLTLPSNLNENPVKGIIIMIRGFVPADIYTTGIGTQNAAQAFASAGYITLAPDFFGHGQSDPEPEDTWQARFEKPLVILELMKSIEEIGIPIGEHDERIKIDFNFQHMSTSTQQSIAEKDTGDLDQNTATASNNLEADSLPQLTNIALWAHSNGGQIALSTAQALNRPIPLTLWAPVTAPFPYSIQYFSDELEDEGKLQRKWIAQFEERYDVFDFSVTQHLNRLHGPIQLHHGLADEAAPYLWSDEFVEKIAKENSQRTTLLEEKTASKSTTTETLIDQKNKPPLSIEYFRYPGTDHNMRPSWNTVVQRDLDFFEREISSQ